jgi:hypothetical protein
MATKKSTRATRRTRRTEEEIAADEGEKFLRQLREAPAVFTDAEMYSLEAKIGADGDGPTRRIALAVLTTSGSRLLDEIAADRDYAVAVADVYQHLDGYLGRLRELTELMSAAQVRMMLALANREDMYAVMQQAKTGDGESLQ